MPEAKLEKEFVTNLKVMAAKTFRAARNDGYSNGSIDWITYASGVVVENVLAVLLSQLKIVDDKQPVAQVDVTPSTLPTPSPAQESSSAKETTKENPTQPKPAESNENVVE